MLLLLLGLLILAALLSIRIGAFPLSLHDLYGALTLAPHTDRTVSAVVLNIRLPRVLLGIFAGAGLGSAGAALQGIFRNPLADPGLIGVSSGAALGAALAIVLAPWAGFATGGLVISIAAFAGSLLVTALVYRLGANEHGPMLHWLLLSGIAINAIVVALIGLLTYVASDAQLRTLTFWSLGSLAGASWGMLVIAAPVILLAALLLCALTPMLNVLHLGENEAAHLGVPVRRLKQAILVGCALAVGAVVSCTGIIGFIGLIAPHCIRLACGPNQRVVLPGSMLLGALLCVTADLIARTLASPAEIPLGILTALLGAPFFLMLLSRGKRAGA
jgi:iron complex transport system permease protein